MREAARILPIVHALKASLCSSLLFSVCLAGLGCDSPPDATPDAATSDAGAAVVGAPCDTFNRCGAGLFCEDSFPGGYCTLDCTFVECDGASICDARVEPALCFSMCESTPDCRDGYQCWGGGCRPPCGGDEDCGGEGAVCDEGICEMSGLADGEGCTVDADCASGICLSGRSVCSAPCTNAASCADFAVAASCGPVTRDGVVDTYCLPRRATGLLSGDACTMDRDCSSNTCVAGLCTEACVVSADCQAGLECGRLPFGTSTFPGCVFPSTSSYVVTLPVVEIPAGSRQSGGRIALPSDVLSATLRVRQTSGAALQMSFDAVAQRSTTFFDLTSLSSLTDVPNRWIPSDTFEDITMLIPNSTADRVSLTGANLRFSIVAFPRTMGDTATIAVAPSVLVRRGADSGMATFDIAVHLVSVGVTAAAAPTDTRVQAMLTRMNEVLGGVGLRIGSVRYIDAPSSSLSVINSAEGEDSELAQLFRMSAPVTARTVSLFLVRSIETGAGGFNTLGIAGGIPGPVDMHGTMHSGVVLAFDPGVVGSGTGGGRFAGMIASHELSHYLGLYHVTERVRPCAAGEIPEGGSCAPFGGGDTLLDTTLGDTSNLMNWSVADGGSNTAISAGQGYVLRRNGHMQPR